MFTEIAQNLKPASLFSPFFPASCRSPWESLPEDLKERLIRDGEQYLHFQFPPILATDFMAFCRIGNRVNYEDKLFQRMTILNALVLAECVEYKGRFLDDIINAVFLICEEAAWQLPAHNNYTQDGPKFPLPDITRPVVDLFAAEAGAILAVTEFLLREAFAKVSPAISVAINHNLKTRVFDPYLEQYFWWMGDGTSHVNNWTSWCTQNVLLAAFTRETFIPNHEIIFQKACQSLDYFLDEYGEDGCCDEGAQYFRHAGLTLFNCLEVLNAVTDQRFASVYEEPKVRNIASYILNVHVHGPYYVNFADCSPVAGRCNAREYLFGKRTNNSKLMAFAAQDYREDEEFLIPGEHNLFYRLQTIFTHKEMMNYGKEEPVSHPDIFYDSVGLFLTRDTHYCLAAKAGDNGDSHNHNDTGSFTIYKDGKPMFIDVGVESYTAKTFSPQRYEIWTMQSAYHNLPTFGNIMQKDGECYGAKDVSYELGQERGFISMDIAPAYPECKELASYLRSVCLEKGKGITISDTWEGSPSAHTLGTPSNPVVLSLMTYEKPVIHQDEDSEACGELQGNSYTMTIGTLGKCLIMGACRIEAEEIPITDPRLGIAWKHSIYRTLVTLGGKNLKIFIEE